MNSKEQKFTHESLRPLRIVVVGAGPSGLLLAYKLQRALSQVSLVIFEKNPGVSGTWHENRYPGCASDLPALNYTYTFEPRYEWSSSYARAAEINNYFMNFYRKYKLSRFVKTEHKVCSTRWLADRGIWVIEVENLRSSSKQTHECEVFVNAGGYLNDYKLPNLRRQEEFKGKVVHSAAWDDELDLCDKNVALVGNSASGVQILPEIQPIAKHITFIMRSPTWLLPPLGIDQESSNKAATRRQNEAIINSYFAQYFSGSASQTAALSKYNQAVRRYIPASLPIDLLFPSSGNGCKRIVPPPSYLPSLRAANVNAVGGTFTSLTRNGLTYTPLIAPSSDAHISPTTCVEDIDIIILATGFHTTHTPRFPIHGPPSLSNSSKPLHHPPQQPQSYLGLANPGLPNYFTLLGPYSPTMNGTTLPGLEAQVEYILQILTRMQAHVRGWQVKYVVPKVEAAEDFLRHWEGWMERRPWIWKRERHASEGGDGGLVVEGETEGQGSKERYPCIWPGTTTHYRQAIREVRWEDWDVVMYEGDEDAAVTKDPHTATGAMDAGGDTDRFAWLGNGICTDPREEMGEYLREADDDVSNITRGVSAGEGLL